MGRIKRKLLRKGRQSLHQRNSKSHQEKRRKEGTVNIRRRKWEVVVVGGRRLVTPLARCRSL
jgi:hypothetical protein